MSGVTPQPRTRDRMTLPAADWCMECHRSVVREKPAIQKLAELAKSKQAIPWVRIYVVSGSVFWNHRSHLEAGMKSCKRYWRHWYPRNPRNARFLRRKGTTPDIERDQHSGGQRSSWTQERRLLPTKKGESNAIPTWATPDFEFRKPVAVDLEVLVKLELWLGVLLLAIEPFCDGGYPLSNHRKSERVLLHCLGHESVGFEGGHRQTVAV